VQQSYEGYSLQELTQATKGFSQELGGGGFGTVYLGNLRGTQVAVKKMDTEGLQVRSLTFPDFFDTQCTHYPLLSSFSRPKWSYINLSKVNLQDRFDRTTVF
jgi:hypothetical protein